MARRPSIIPAKVASAFRLASMAWSLGVFIAAYSAISPFTGPRGGRILFMTDAAATPKGNLAVVLDAVTAAAGDRADIYVSSRRSLWAVRGLWSSIRLAYRARTSRVIVIDDYVPELNMVPLHHAFTAQPGHRFGLFWRGHGQALRFGGLNHRMRQRMLAAALQIGGKT